MRKILSSLLILFVAVVLVACGDGYKEVELTSAEISELLTSLEYGQMDGSTKQMMNFVFKGEGELQNTELIFNPETYHYDSITTLTTLLADIDISAYAAVGSELENFLLLLNVENFLLEINNNGEKVSINASNNQLFHGGDGHVYANLNLELKEGNLGVTYAGKYKSDEAISALDYSEFVQGLENSLALGDIIADPGFDLRDIMSSDNIEQLIEYFNLTISQSGNSYKLSMKINRDTILNTVIDVLFNFTSGIGEIPAEAQAQIDEMMEQIKSAIKKFEVSFELIITDNRVVSTIMEASINIDTSSLSEDDDLGIPYIKLNIETFKLVIKNTTENVVIPTDLNTYTKSFDELNDLPFN